MCLAVTIWRAVVEDYAPFDVDVTTIQPASVIRPYYIIHACITGAFAGDILPGLAIESQGVIGVLASVKAVLLYKQHSMCKADEQQQHEFLAICRCRKSGTFGLHLMTMGISEPPRSLLV
jgi:hypothetical protein